MDNKCLIKYIIALIDVYIMKDTDLYNDLNKTDLIKSIINSIEENYAINNNNVILELIDKYKLEIKELKDKNNKLTAQIETFRNKGRFLLKQNLSEGLYEAYKIFLSNK
jgi:hypothetical protein